LLLNLDKTSAEIWFLALVSSHISSTEKKYFQDLEEAGVKVMRIRLRGHFDPLCFSRLNKFIKETVFDIVHCHLIHADIYAIFSSKLNRVPVIISTRHNDNPFRKNILIKRFLAWLYSQTTIVITVSRHLAHFCQMYEDLDAEKIRTIYHGISNNQTVSNSTPTNINQRLSIPPDAFVCLTVGRMIEQKGHKYLIEAIPNILQHGKFCFIFVGDGPLKKKLVEQAENLGVSGSTRFVGWKENVSDYYQIADVLVHPSIWEGFGIVLIEALKEGLPVLATNVGAIPEILDDLPSTKTIEPKSSASLSNGVLHFWKNRSTLSDFNRAAKIYQEKKFGISAMVLKTETLYDELAGQHGKTRIAHIITGLNVGGAEQMLAKLSSQTIHSKYLVEVISLSKRGSLADKIEKSGIIVTSLDINPQLPNPLKLASLLFRLWSFNPDLVQTWMYHADFFGGGIARLAGIKNIVWNIRNGTLNRKHLKFTTNIIIKLSSLFSTVIPKKIVSCSLNAIEYHESLGYEAKKMHYLPNGFELDRFRSDKMARKQLRRLLKIDHKMILIGMVARYHPQKDHKTFLAAANLLSKKFDNVHFALVGEGLNSSNRDLMEIILGYSLQDRIHLLGKRNDPEVIYPALDIFTLSSSFGEGFPNVIGEAMACEIPVVATRDGDVEKIISEFGILVEKENPRDLANKWGELLSYNVETRKNLGKMGRAHIAKNYEISKVANQYFSLYNLLISASYENA
jgi:glycosyltransferase involved in cell wall biosynthesis